MSHRLWNAIHETCEAIRRLPAADAPLQVFNDLGIDRARYDSTLPIREKLTEVLEFLSRFEVINPEKFPKIPASIVESLLLELGILVGITHKVQEKCKLWPQTAIGVVPPSFGEGEIAAEASSADHAYGRIYSELNSSLPRSNTFEPPEHIGAKEKIVFSLHGIRTRAEWQRAFADVAQSERWDVSSTQMELWQDVCVQIPVASCSREQDQVV
jgi:hypothetical protein